MEYFLYDLLLFMAYTFISTDPPVMFGASRILTRPAYSLEALDINLLSRYGSIAKTKFM